MTLSTKGSTDVVWKPFPGNDKSTYGKTYKGRVVDMEDYSDIVGMSILFNGRLCSIEGCDRDVGLTLVIDHFGVKNYCFCIKGRSLAHQSCCLPTDIYFDVVEKFIDEFAEQVRSGDTCGGLPIITDNLLNSVISGIGGYGENPSADTCAFNQ